MLPSCMRVCVPTALAACLLLLGSAGCSSGGAKDPVSPGGASGSAGGSGGTAGNGGSAGSGAAGGAGAAGAGGGGAGSGGGGNGGGAAGADAGAGTGGGPAPSRDGAASLPDVRLEPDGPPPVCNYPNWAKGTAYKTGDIVMYMGKPYQATSDNPGYDPLISTFFWTPFTGCTPPPPPPAAMCPLLDKLLPNGEATFTAMFTPTFMGWVPLAAYSYSSLCNALATPGLAAFARSGNATQDKRELAAFFANVAIETAYLTAIDEKGHSASERDFHGRGSLQITGQPIYSEAGAALGIDLVGQPQLASREPAVWQTGIWYWTLHGNPSVGGAICHNAIAQSDFGQTVRIIKGDCGSAGIRADQYRKNCTMLGVAPGNTSCP
jgi:predicted chitinase